MIVVVGSPIAQPSTLGIRAAGLGADVARAAAAAGASVQIVGRVGEDPEGDLVLLALAANDVGHVAVLREPGRPTPMVEPPAPGSAGPDGPALGEALLDEVAGELDPAALDAVVAAVAWSGAHLVVLLPDGSSTATLPDSATVLLRPTRDPDGAFAAMVAGYAVALDQGDEPQSAFAAAQRAAGWAAVAD